MILFALTLALCVIYEVFFHFNNYKASFWAILNDIKTRKCILPAASLGLDIAREQRIYYKRLKNMARRLERRKGAISLLRFDISPLCVVRHSLRKIPYKKVCLYYWLFLSRFSCHHVKPAIIHIAIPLWNGAKWLKSRDLLLVFFFSSRVLLLKVYHSRRLGRLRSYPKGSEHEDHLVFRPRRLRGQTVLESWTRNEQSTVISWPYI